METLNSICGILFYTVLIGGLLFDYLFVVPGLVGYACRNHHSSEIPEGEPHGLTFSTTYHPGIRLVEYWRCSTPDWIRENRYPRNLMRCHRFVFYFSLSFLTYILVRTTAYVIRKDGIAGSDVAMILLLIGGFFSDRLFLIPELIRCGYFERTNNSEPSDFAHKLHLANRWMNSPPDWIIQNRYPRILLLCHRFVRRYFFGLLVAYILIRVAGAR